MISLSCTPWLTCDPFVTTLVLTERIWWEQGSGEVKLEVQSLSHGVCLPAIRLTERGQITKITIEAIACGIDIEIADRMAAAAQKALKKVLLRANKAVTDILVMLASNI